VRIELEHRDQQRQSELCTAETDEPTENRDCDTGKERRQWAPDMVAGSGGGSGGDVISAASSGSGSGDSSTTSSLSFGVATLTLVPLSDDVVVSTSSSSSRADKPAGALPDPTD